MSLRQVVLLALLALLLGGVVWWLQDTATPGSTDSAQGMTGQMLPGLDQQLDAVNRLTITDANGDLVTLNSSDGNWVVEQKHDYRADQIKVKNLLIALSEMAPVEAKTSNPEYYERLGLREISDAESRGKKIEVAGAGSPISVLVGDATARFGGSNYVRLTDQAQSWLATPSIHVDTDIDSWLEKSVLNVAADQIQSIAVVHAEGQEVEVSKDAMFGSDFKLDLPEERTVNTTAINTLAGGLTGLSFDDVDQASRFAIRSYHLLRVSYRLFDGIIIEASLFSPPSEEKEDLGYWFAAEARFDETLAKAYVPQPSAQVSDQAQEAASKSIELTAADLEDRKNKADEINRQLNGWMYKITAARYENFAHTMESLSSAVNK